MKNYKDLLNISLDTATPPLREDVKTAPIVTSSHLEESETPRRVRRRRPAYLRAAVAACLSLVLVLTAVTAVLLTRPQDTPPAGATTDYRSYITVDINPSFSLTVDSTGRVTNVVAENYDGEVVLDSIAADNISLALPYDNTLRLLLGYTKTLGYFTTSDGIQVGIYQYHTDDAVKEEMRTHISSVVASVGEGTPPLSIAEIARDALVEMAGELFEGITAAIGEEDLFRLLNEKRGFGDRRHDGEAVVSDDLLLELTYAYYAIASLDRMRDSFEELDVYLAEEGITAGEAFDLGGREVKRIQNRVNRLLAWMGDTRTLTSETYEALRESTEAYIREEDRDALSAWLDVYRFGGHAFPAQTAEEVYATVTAETHVGEITARIKAKYGANTDVSAFRIITTIESSWRLDTQFTDATDWLPDFDFLHGEDKKNEEKPEGQK